MARGPKPTPTAVLNNRNSWRGVAREKAGEPPGIRTASPKVPGDLNAKERHVWRSLCSDLDTLGVLTESDARAAYRYARYFVLWRDLMDWLADNGEFSESEDGADVVRPQVRRVETLETAMLKIEDRFGLTPSARARLRAETKPVADSKAAKFFGKVAT